MKLAVGIWLGGIALLALVSLLLVSLDHATYVTRIL